MSRRSRRLKRALRKLRALPVPAQIGAGVLVLMGLAFAGNWTYQVIRKPTELFFPVSGALDKTPAQTWREYEPIFRAHATDLITPDFLAALAQVESIGNPVATTYWRWRFTPEPFEVYRPASSAVGMYQITDGTFAEAKRFCIHDHAAVRDGPWHAWRSCWFNRFYFRVVPSHAVEMTLAFLDRRVTEILERHRLRATRQQSEDLAAVIHLCGAGAGEAFARRRFTFAPDQRCGDHDARAYVARVHAMKRLFARY